MSISERGQQIASHLTMPWRYALSNTYNPSTNPDGLVAFSAAENLLVQDELVKLSEDIHMTANTFRYGFAPVLTQRFAKALAGHFNEYFYPHTPLTSEEILVGNTATALNENIAFAFANAGDGILTTRPVYGRYELDFGLRAGVKMVYAETEAKTCFQPDVIDTLEKAFVNAERNGTKIRALLIINPHNPLGRCYPRETLVELMKFCQKHQIHFISDEILGYSVFDSSEPDTLPFTSILSINTEGLIDPTLCHVIYAMSKDFGAAGLRIGAIVTRNVRFKQVFEVQEQFHEPSGPSLVLATAMLQDREWCRQFLKISQERLAAAFRHVTDGLKEMVVRYLPGSNAGFFIWVDLSPYLPKEGTQQEREFQLAQKLVDSNIFLHPGEEHSIDAGWFRLVYTTSSEVVTEGLKRLAIALK